MLPLSSKPSLSRNKKLICTLERRGNATLYYTMFITYVATRRLSPGGQDCSLTFRCVLTILWAVRPVFVRPPGFKIWCHRPSESVTLHSHKLTQFTHRYTHKDTSHLLTYTTPGIYSEINQAKSISSFHGALLSCLQSD